MCPVRSDTNSVITNLGNSKDLRWQKKRNTQWTSISIMSTFLRCSVTINCKCAWYDQTRIAWSQNWRLKDLRWQMKTNCKKAPKSLAHSWDVASPFSSYEGMTCRSKETEALSKSGWTIKPIIVRNIAPSGGGQTQIHISSWKKGGALLFVWLSIGPPVGKRKTKNGKEKDRGGF